MRFYRGQEVKCISDVSEWDSAIGDFNMNLMIAVNSDVLPKKDKTYIIDCPNEINHRGKCYLSLVGFSENIFDESGFIEISISAKKEFEEEKKLRIFTYKN